MKSVRATAKFDFFCKRWKSDWQTVAHVKNRLAFLKISLRHENQLQGEFLSTTCHANILRNREMPPQNLIV
jgi:hypothetical protein